MTEPKICCNCLHCARWRKKDGIETHCDLTDKYLGYLDVFDEDRNCKHWEKETKWDLQKKHDAEIRSDERAKTIDEIENGLLRLMLISEERKDIDFARGDWDLVYTVLADYVEISDLRIEEKWQQLKGDTE